jgi:sugar lactone lactonase YvrE
MALHARSVTYEVVDGWGRGPGCPTLGLVSAVGIDSRDQVYVFNRLPDPVVLVYDREGHFLRSWGEGLFTTPHGLWINPDDRVFLADCGDHTVRICTTDGQVQQTLGTAGQAGAAEMPFNQPTWAKQSPSGETYVSDGYGQFRVHRFSADGRLLKSWGSKGEGPGEFALPHSVVVDRRGRVLVADRENHRVQIFDGDGQFLEQWTDLLQPMDLFIDADDAVYVAEAQQRISVYSLDGELLSRWGEKGSAPGQFSDSPHGVCVDSRGDLYVCEVISQGRMQKFARV